MNNKVKILNKLIERIEDYKYIPSDDFMNEYNRGLNTAICLLNEKIEYIEKAES